MKKLLCILLSSFLALSISSCTPDGSIYGTTNDTVHVWEYTYPNEAAITTSFTATTTTITTAATTNATTTATRTKQTRIKTTRRTVEKAVTHAVVDEYDNSYSTNDPQSNTVYITPTGKRYHLLSTCGGKNSFAVSLEEALARNLTPCKKCAS